MISYTLEQTGLLEGKINFFTEIHQKHYSSAFKMFKNNPIFGVGPKMFRVECKNEKYKVKGACATHPHNFYIQLLSETGIIGFIFLFSSFIITSFYYFKTLFKWIIIDNINKEVAITSTILIYVYIWPIIPHMSFFNNWINGLPFFIIGIVLHIQNNKNYI